MRNNIELEAYIDNVDKLIKNKGYNFDYADALYKSSILAYREEKLDLFNHCTTTAKQIIEEHLGEQTGVDIWGVENYLIKEQKALPEMSLYYDILKQESFQYFESFMYYMERYRKQEDRFYLPRKCTLGQVAQDFQDLEDGKYTRYALSQPSRTGKSTTFLMFLSWVAMKRPNSHNAYGCHAGELAKGVYEEFLNFFTTPEYAFSELYSYWHPLCPLIENKSAESSTINLDKKSRFPTIVCRGADATWTGAVDVSADGYLCVDDLVRDREHALNPRRMEDTYQAYQNKMLDRLNDGSKVILVGTLWNVLDPIERERKANEGKPEWLFRKIPALNENGESNFQYTMGKGFSTKYFEEMRDRLSKPDWMAKFQQQPYVREGLLFPEDECRFFNGMVNDTKHKVVSLIDPAFGGADSTSMPIVRIEEDSDSYKVIDWVHKSGTQKVTLPLIVDAIEKHFITELYIEQNSGGKLMTDKIEEELKTRNLRFCKINRYYARTRLPKEEKIKAYSDYVKDNFEFLMENKYLSEEAEYRRTEMYNDAMYELHMYTSEGKNFHDDSPDAITSLWAKLENAIGGSVSAVHNPFKYGEMNEY